MNLRRTLTIFYKDARDAIRDGRVLVAIAIPLAIGLFYNATMDENPEDLTPTADVAYTAQSAALVEALRESLGGAVDASFEEAGAGEVRALVEEGEADVGIIAADDLRPALEGGGTPEVRVLLPEGGGAGGELVASAVDPALRALAGQPAPAAVQVEPVPVVRDDSANAFAVLGFDTYMVLASVVFLIGMIAVFVVPILLAEETEKKTLEALVMISSYPEVIGAKALVGVLYTAVSVTLLLGLTQLRPENLPLFAGTVVLMSLSLVGFGLLFGGFFRSANQLNTWGGFLLIPVVAPAFAAGFESSGWVEMIVAATPTGQGMRLAVNGMSGEEVFSDLALSFLVMAAWCVAGFGALLLNLRYRQSRS
jgi:ABC-type Na+ efflux pump permease subunit